MKQTGVWIDKQKAIIVSLEEGDVNLKEIVSNVETFKIHGGSGTKMKGGPQDVVQDSRYLEREKHQLRGYFEEVIEDIKHSNQIMIFGPAEIPLKLAKEIELNYRSVSNKVKSVEKSDSMTDNQVKAYVRDYFDS